ncbi:MAG: hypothetical protein QGI86_26185 [Candidatus Poribacteria bacterium]|nr:hypothetical protein [Candidatus Poribacteria bacterium]
MSNFQLAMAEIILQYARENADDQSYQDATTTTINYSLYPSVAKDAANAAGKGRCSARVRSN